MILFTADYPFGFHLPQEANIMLNIYMKNAE